MPHLQHTSRFNPGFASKEHLLGFGRRSGDVCSLSQRAQFHPLAQSEQRWLRRRMPLLRPWLAHVRPTWRSCGSRRFTPSYSSACHNVAWYGFASASECPRCLASLLEEKILSHALQPLEQSEDESEEAQRFGDAAV